MNQISLAEVVDNAFWLHKAQSYGGIPYSHHLNHVNKTYRYLFGYAEDSIVKVIYLHDSLEDTVATETYLLIKGLSRYEVDVIKLLTKDPNSSKLEYLEKLSTNKDAVMVKIADSTSNLMYSYKSGNIRLIEKYQNNLEILWGYYGKFN